MGKQTAELTVRELNFIKAFTEIGGDTYNLPQESALKAGFVESTVGLTARRLMANPKVLCAINEVYADRMENTPTNIARIMSNLDNTEALALKYKAMPTLTKIAEMRGRYLDIWASNNSADNEEEPTPLSDEDLEKIRIIIRLMDTDLQGVVAYLRERRSWTT